MGKKFYTPDGFNDILPEVAAFKREAEAKLRNLFAKYGYMEIETPGFEYCDIYTATDFVGEEDLYKITDQKGRLLAARYDGTVPVARYAATTYKDYPAPLRFSYIENMYRFKQMGGGKQSGFTQAGVELMGVKGADSDAEVIALAILSALEIGVTDLQVSVGQVEIFKGIARQMKLSEEDTATVREAINARDSVTIEKVASKLGLSEEDKDVLLMLPEALGTYDVLEELRGKVKDETAAKALDHLKEILDILTDYDLIKYVNVDLGLAGSEDYYTGMIFKGYTYEVGFPIISGGRYDNVVKKFGRDLEAVGFSLGLSLAITALARQDKEFPKARAEAIVGYDRHIKGARRNALVLAQSLRADGTSVIFDSSAMTEDELEAYSEKMEIPATFFVNQGEDE